MAAEKDDSRIVPVHFCRVTVIFRCIITSSLIINDLHLKRQTTQKFTCFLRKIEDLTVFFHRLSPNRGKRGKNGPWGPRQTSSAKIGHVGVYFAKTGCKIEDGFTDIFVFRVRYIVHARSGRRGPTFTTRLLTRFAAKREKWLSPFSWRSHLFSSLILTLL